MAIVKNRLKKRFSTVPNAIITDKSISANALRVYLYIASKSEEWEVNNADIQKQLGIKQAHTLAKYWKELMASGWLSRDQKRDDKGKLNGGYDYLLWEDAEMGKNHNVEKPTLGKNHTLNNTEIINKTEDNKKNIKKDLVEQLSDSRGITEVERISLKTFIAYRREIKKPVTTTRPLNAFLNQLIDIQAAGYTIKYAIGSMMDNEWKTVKVEWLDNISKRGKSNNNMDKIDQVLAAREKGLF